MFDLLFYPQASNPDLQVYIDPAQIQAIEANEDGISRITVGGTLFVVIGNAADITKDRRNRLEIK